MITSKVFTPPILNNNNNLSSSPVINTQNNHMNKSFASLSTKDQTSSRSVPMSLSVPILLLPTTNEQNTTCMTDNNKLMPSQHIKTMKVIQSTSSSLSDFIVSTPTSTLKSTSKYIFIVYLFKKDQNKCQLYG